MLGGRNAESRFSTKLFAYVFRVCLLSDEKKACFLFKQRCAAQMHLLHELRSTRHLKYSASHLRKELSASVTAWEVDDEAGAVVELWGPKLGCDR